MKTETGIDMDQHAVRRLGTSYWQARVLHAANALGLFGALGGGSKTADELASSLHATRRGIEILLTACAALDLVTKSGERYSNSPFAQRFLVPGSPEYQGDLIRMYGDDYEVWLHLEEAVRTGAIASIKPHFLPGSDGWDRYMDAMYNSGVFTSKILVEEVKLSPAPSRLLDLGGGPGAYSIAYAKAYPSLHATIFDLKVVEETARAYARKAGLEGRIDFRAGDYAADPFPGDMDLVLFSNIIHANSLEDFIVLLKKAHQSMKPGGFVLVNDFFLNDEKTSPEFAALFGVNMLVSTQKGRTYSNGEVKSALESAGFGQIRFQDLPRTPYAVAIGRKA